MNDKQKDILKKYIKVGEPLFISMLKILIVLMQKPKNYHHAETHKKEQKVDIAYFSLITGRRGSGKGY